MKTIHRLAAAIASIAITSALFTAVVSEARPPVDVPTLAQVATTTMSAAR
jgi:hypothetical protein